MAQCCRVERSARRNRRCRFSVLHALGKRPNGQNHNEAVHLLETVPGNGAPMAKLLTRLLSAKSLSQYSLDFMTRPNRTSLKAASDLVDEARQVLAR